MLAAGGIFSEALRDRSIRLAPVDLETAREMVGELASLRVLAGYRGRPRGDLEALAAALMALSGLAHDATVLEAEVNPLVVMEEGRGVVRWKPLRGEGTEEDLPRAEALKRLQPRTP